MNQSIVVTISLIIKIKIVVLVQIIQILTKTTPQKIYEYYLKEMNTIEFSKKDKGKTMLYYVQELLYQSKDCYNYSKHFLLMKPKHILLSKNNT